MPRYFKTGFRAQTVQYVVINAQATLLCAQYSVHCRNYQQKGEDFSEEPQRANEDGQPLHHTSPHISPAADSPIQLALTPSYGLIAAAQAHLAAVAGLNAATTMTTAALICRQYLKENITDETRLDITKHDPAAD